MSELVKAVMPARGRGWLSGGLGWVAGYVVRREDIAAASGVPALHAELGLGFPGSPIPVDAPHLDVLRIPSTGYAPLSSPGRPEADPPFADHPPMSGTGFVESASGFVPYWWMAPSAIPAGTTLWRHHADGREELLAAYVHVAEGWVSARSDQALPPAQLRSPQLIGVWAEVGGERLLADVLPDGTAVLCAPRERPGMQQSPRGVWWRTATPAEVERVYAVRVVGTWQGRPAQLVDLEETPSGVIAHIVYLGHDAFEAESLSMTKTDAGLYEASVPATEVHDLNEEQSEIALSAEGDGHRSGSGS